MKTVAPTGPPRPGVYCLRKCFGGEKAAGAFKQATDRDLPGLKEAEHRVQEREGGRE